MKTVKTSKGTDLPLMQLKGKDYMLVAHRLVWFNEDVANFNIHTEYLKLTDTEATIKATVTIFNEDGSKVVKSAQGTKSESKADFKDFVEKAETGAIGRAITMLGYGTAFALADLDEGSRIIDAPLQDPREVQQASANAPSASAAPASGASAAPTRKSTFRKAPSLTEAAAKVAANDANGWD